VRFQLADTAVQQRGGPLHCRPPLLLIPRRQSVRTRTQFPPPLHGPLVPLNPKDEPDGGLLRLAVPLPNEKKGVAAKGAKGVRSPLIKMTNPSAPCFNLVTFDAKDPWESLLDHAKPELSLMGLKRLEPLLKGQAKSVVVERHYIDKDYRDTFSHFHSKRFNTPPSRCLRLHFFAQTVTEADIINGAEAVQKNYLGYSVIRPTKPNCIGRTLISHTLRMDGKAHMSTCEEEVNLVGTKLMVRGFPFISQDSDATVCAESSLWMLLRYFSNRYSWYPEVLPFQITNTASHHAVGRRVFPSSGLYSWQMAEALRLQHFSPIIYNHQAPQYQSNFYHLLYTYIESGVPLLVIVPGHVIVCNGHVSDYRLPMPPPSAPPAHVYTSHFNRSLVVSDDNCFPYQLLHAGGPTQAEHSLYKWDNINEFIVALPERVFLPAEHVQTAIEKVIKDLQPMSASLHGKRLLLRLYLTSARSFKRHLHARGMGHPDVERIYRFLPLPHFVWICEIADYQEYANDKKIVGELIWDATRNAHEPDGLMALHLPEKLIYDEGAAYNCPQSLKVIDLKDPKSYLLFQSNLHTL
jgi:hypothetical protein